MPSYERFEPETTGSAPITPGIHKATITDVIEVTQDFSQWGYDWAIAFEFVVDGNPYTKKIVYKDKFERTPDGKLDRKKNKGIASLNKALMLVQFNGGFDSVGVWRDSQGEERSIAEGATDVLKHVHSEYGRNDFLVYAYTSQGKKDPTKFYIELAKRFYLVGQEEEMKSYVSYLLKMKEEAAQENQASKSL